MNGEIDPEEVTDRLRRAGLPMAVRHMTTSRLPSAANTALAYIQSPEYQAGLQDGRGINLAGTSPASGYLLTLVAKAHALSGHGVWFCSLQQLVDRVMYTDNDGSRPSLVKYRYLFIEYFEKKFPDGGCPHTFAERSRVEELLVARYRNGLITNYTSAAPIKGLKWWSDDIRNLIAENTQDIII